MSADKNLYRVWPDGWVQDASEEPYSWRSDDLLVIAALPELLGAADNALGVLIASVIPAGGADEPAACKAARSPISAARRRKGAKLPYKR